MVYLKQAIRGFVTVYKADMEALWQKLGLNDTDLPVEDAIAVLEQELEDTHNLLEIEQKALGATLKKLTKESEKKRPEASGEVTLRLEEDFRNLLARDRQREAQIAELQSKLDRSAQTSRAHARIGQEMQQAGEKVDPSSWTFFTLLSSTDPLVEAAVRAVKRRWPDASATGITFTALLKEKAEKRKKRKLAGQETSTAGTAGTAGSSCAAQQETGLQLDLTLADITGAGEVLQAPSGQFKEEEHMQQPVFRMLQAINSAVKPPGNPDGTLVDTHSSGMQNPASQPDAVRLVEPSADPAWSIVDHHYEFKLSAGESDTRTAFGQLTERTQHCLAAQRKRVKMPAAQISMDSVQLLLFTSTARVQQLAGSAPIAGSSSSGTAAGSSEAGAAGKLQLTYTEPLPLSISTTSLGFRALCSLLACTPVELGYLHNDMPSLPFLQHTVLIAILIAQGQAYSGGSYVFKVKVQDKHGIEQWAAAKLCKTSAEAEHTRALKGAPHVVELLDECECSAWGGTYHAMLLAPWVHRVTSELDLAGFVQVLQDVASGLQAVLGLDMLHCDVGLNNMGWYMVNSKQRGVLLDFSTVKVASSTSPSKELHEVTGTFLYMAASVLLRERHTQSSQLESLFISAVAASCGGRVPDEPSGLELEAWVRHRWAMFASPVPLPCAAEHLRPLVTALHDLFWPVVPGARSRGYNRSVSTEDFLRACQDLLAAEAVN